MSTPNPVTFPPLTEGISWTLSTTSSGVAVPEGEVTSSVLLGIRPDGNSAYSRGSYWSNIAIQGAATSETLAAINSALKSALPPGNYWGNVQQTDTLSGQSATSAWMPEDFPFSIPQPSIATPDAPSNPKVA